MRELTVMFSDIRNFTPLSESMSADALVPLLNDLFTELSQEILDCGGTIDKFIGDSVMAFWNAPLNVEDHSRQAALSALGMRDAMLKFQNNRPDVGRIIEIGIGLHSGEACVGNIGSRQRFNYSAIGNAVNVAARIESSCKDVGFDIVASSQVQAAARDLAWLPLGSVALKGVGQRQELFALVGGVEMAQSAEFKALEALHASLLELVSHDRDFKEDLHACREAAATLMNRLVPIYENLPERLADFHAGNERKAHSTF
jgi:adenylate cyclase